MLSLCESLKTLLDGVFEKKLLPNRRGEMVAPEMIVGWIPPKKAGDDGDRIPCVQIVPLAGETSSVYEEGSICTVILQIQTWSGDHRGWADCLNLIQDIRLALLSLPGRTLDERYRMEPVGDGKKLLEWRLYEDQPDPFWIAEVTVHFGMSTPEALPIPMPRF